MHLLGVSFSSSQYLQWHKAEQTMPLKFTRYPLPPTVFIFSLSVTEENNKSLILLQPDGDSISSCLAGCMVSWTCAWMHVSVAVSFLLYLSLRSFLPYTLWYRPMVLKRGSGSCRYSGANPLPRGRIHWEHRRTMTWYLIFLSFLYWDTQLGQISASLAPWSGLPGGAIGIQGGEKRDARERKQDAVDRFIRVVWVPSEYINSFIYHSTIIRNLNYLWMPHWQNV